jgi:hypothetical protein
MHQVRIPVDLPYALLKWLVHQLLGVESADRRVVRCEGQAELTLRYILRV